MIIRCSCGKKLRVTSPPSRVIKVVCPNCGKVHTRNLREPDQNKIVEGYKRGIALYIDEYLKIPTVNDVKVVPEDYDLTKQSLIEAKDLKLKIELFDKEIDDFKKKRKKWYYISIVPTIVLFPFGIIGTIIILFLIYRKSEIFIERRELSRSEEEILYKFNKYSNKEITKEKKFKESVVPDIIKYIRIEHDLYRKIAARYNQLIGRKKSIERNNFHSSFHSVKDLQSLEPRLFEELVAEFFEQKGYDAEMTGYTNDQGIDIKLKKNGETSVVQCKRYKGRVSAPEIRNFLGAMVHDHVESGFFVTTGKFTKQAIETSKSNNICLINGNELLRAIGIIDDNKGWEKSLIHGINYKIRNLYCSYFGKIVDDYGYIANKKIKEYNRNEIYIPESEKYKVTQLRNFLKAGYRYF